MKNYTVEQKIQIANIISKSNQHTLPYVLDIFGINRLVDIKRIPQAVDDTITEFLAEIDDINGKVSKEVYTAYVNYCKNKGTQPLTHIEFSRQVNRALKSCSVVKRVNGISCRVFVNKKGGDCHQES